MREYKVLIKSPKNEDASSASFGSSRVQFKCSSKTFKIKEKHLKIFGNLLSLKSD